jgi:putative transposase
MILRNDLLEWDEPNRRVVRILWIDALSGLAYVFDLACKTAKVERHRLPALESALALGRARKLEADPYLVLVNQQALPPKYMEARDRAWQMLAELVEQEPAIYEARRRGELVQEAARRHGISHPTIYRYLRRFWQRGQTPNALLPDYANSGGPGKTRLATPGVKRGRPRKDTESPGINIDEAMRTTMHLAAARHAAAHTHFSRRTAYEELLGDFLCKRTADPYSRRLRRTPASGPLPSFGQFNYWLEHGHMIDGPALPAPLPDNTPVTLRGRPGAAFRLDMLPFAMQLLHAQDRNMLAGAPTLYVVTDVFSGMVAGFYASLEAPGWSNAMMALASCAADKARLARRHGRLLAQQEWPCCHMPERLLLPPELMARAHRDTLLANFHVRCVPDYEVPERRWLPSLRACFGSAAGGAGKAMDGLLTLAEFRRIVLDRLLAYNHSRGSEGWAPLQLWDWGARLRGASLRQFPEDLVRCCLLPTSEAWVTGEGICVQGRYFSCMRAEAEHWFDSARVRGRWPVQVAVDPTCEDAVYLVDAAAPLQFHDCHPIDRISMVHEHLQVAGG